MGTSALLAAFLLIVLHRIDGHDVTINAEQVTSLRSTVRAHHIAAEGNCLVGLTDGKFVTVLETCADVKRLLEGTKR